MKCKNCMTEMEEGTLFCPECGTKVEDCEFFCPNCGKKTNSEHVFCEFCGYRLKGDSKADKPVAEETGAEADKTITKDTVTDDAKMDNTAAGNGDVQTELCFCPNCGNQVESNSLFCEACGFRLGGGEVYEEAINDAKKKPKLSLFFGGIAVVAVIAAGIFTIPKILGNSGAAGVPSELFYTKDGGLYGVNLKGSKKKPVEYTDDMSEFVGYEAFYNSFDNAELDYTGPQFVSKDGKYHFIIEDIGSSDGSYSLYSQKGKNEPEKIDSGIQGIYQVTDDNKVVYLKNDNLYVHNLKEKEKLASDVITFMLDKAGKNILWQTDSGNGDGTRDIYYQDLALKKDKIKIDGGVTLKAYSSDLNTLLLLKDGSVYLVKNQGDKEKLAGNVENLYSIDLKAGSFFYTVQEEGAVNVMDYVSDDLAGQDAQMKEPVRSDYERQESTGGFYSKTRTVLDDKYYEDRDKYNEKLARDELRQELRDMEIDAPYVELYYYSNGEKTLVTSEFIKSVQSAFYEKDKEKNKDFTSFMLYRKANTSDIKKVKLSEITYASEAARMIQEAKNGVDTLCLYQGNKEVELDLTDKIIKDSVRDVKNNLIYCLIGDKGKSSTEKEYDMISISLNSSSLGDIEERDSDVDNLELIWNGNVYYSKDVNDRAIGDLYYNGRQILSDVQTDSVMGMPDSSAVVCFTDPSRDKLSSTLTKIKGDKTEKLSDDVSFIHPFGENSVVIMTEFNIERFRGDLKYYNGKDIETLDTDVNMFFH